MTMTDQTYTTEEIREKIETNQTWLERGVLAIYAKQTAYEQQTEDTRELNGVGFSGADGRYFSYVAKWLKSGKHLSGQHVEKSRNKMLKYSGQLAKIANGEI